MQTHLRCWGMAAALGLLASAAQAAGFRKGPYLIYADDNTRMTVLWQTDETPGKSWIEWGRTESLGKSSDPLAENDPDPDEHRFTYTITGLKPGTRYHYRVNVDGNRSTGSFTAAPPADAGAVTIYGYGDTRTYPDDHDTVCGALMKDAAVSGARQTLCLHSGDWTSRGSGEVGWEEQYFTRESQHALEFMASMPVMGCRGNHEGDGSHLRKYWPYHYRDDYGCYYSFDYGPVHVTVIDQYDEYTEGSAQYEWIRKDLAETKRAWKIVLYHEPAWSAGGRHPDNEESREDLCPLFEKANVAVVLAGHNHYYARCEVNGIQHVTSGGGGAPLYRPSPFQSDAVIAEPVHHFIRFDISGDTMKATAIDVNGDVIDSFTVRRSGAGTITRVSPPPETGAGRGSTAAWTAAAAIGLLVLAFVLVRRSSKGRRGA